MQTQEGFVIPENMIKERELIIQIAEGEEAKEIEKVIENQRIIREQKIKKKKERRAEINKKISGKKKKEDAKQLRFFADF